MGKKNKKKFDSADLIYPMTFVSVNTDKFENEEAGVKKGDVLFVVGSRALPLEEHDPYTQRIFMLCQPVVDDYIDTTAKIYIFDPKSLTNLHSEEHDRLYKLAEERANATLQ